MITPVHAPARVQCERRLLFHVRQDVRAAGGFDHVVQETEAATGVDVSERARLAPEDEQRLRTRAAPSARADVCQLPLDAIGEGVARRFDADTSAERADGLGDVGQAPVIYR
jgi:hypothetical protein